MIYREIKVDGFLENFIQCFWYFDTEDEDVSYTILPDGYFDLIVEFSEDIMDRIRLTGIWSKPQKVEIKKNTKYFSIRFKLLAAEFIFKREMKTILNESFYPSLEFWSIYKYKSDEFENFVSGISDYIEKLITSFGAVDERKRKLFHLAYHKSVYTVSEIAKEVSWSSRQINRYFNNQFGFSLKEFLNIIRFRECYRGISSGNLYPYDGYFDQSHFIKEVKKYSGTTPKELYRNEDDRFLQLITVNK